MLYNLVKMFVFLNQIHSTTCRNKQTVAFFLQIFIENKNTVVFLEKLYFHYLLINIMFPCFQFPGCFMYILAFKFNNGG